MSAAGYDYANGRIRGLRGRLLRPGELEALAAQPGVAELAAALLRTDYGLDLQELTGELSSLLLVERALQRNLARRLHRLPAFFPSGPQPSPRRLCGGASPHGPDGRRLGQGSGGSVGMPLSQSRPGQLVGILLGRYDVANLVTLLRGTAAGAPPLSIEAALLPAGLLGVDELAVLARAATVGEVIDRVQRWGVPAAVGLATARPEFERGGPLAALELAAWRGYLEWAREQLRGQDVDTTLVREAVTWQVDAVNLLVVLRLVHRGARLTPGQVAAQLLPGGSLATGWLVDLASAGGLAGALERLACLPLGRALAHARHHSMVRDEMSALELAAEGYLTRWYRAQVYRAPLGIGPALAYQAEKVAEVRRLRLIARGLELRWPHRYLRELLATA